MSHIPISYKDAGVDIQAGQALVERIKSSVQQTQRPEVLSSLGGFAALCRLPHDIDHPLLVSATDGVGTKLRLAIDWNMHEHIGVDLVAMCVNDVLVQGAAPLFFLDYFATGKLDLEQATTVVQSIAQGCIQAGCALVGGETAEMPGMYQTGDYDLAGFCVGVVEHNALINGHRVREGDAIIGLAASGPHANGFSLIRQILAQQSAQHLSQRFNGQSLREALMAPTRIYTSSVLKLLKQYPVHAMCHITGGGLVENLPRVLSSGLTAVIDRTTWVWPDIFHWLQQACGQDDVEMMRTFNCGIGYVLIVPQAQGQHCIDELQEQGEVAMKIGEITQTTVAMAQQQVVFI